MLKLMKQMMVAILVACLLSMPLTASSMTFEDERKLSREVLTSIDAEGLLVYDQEITWPVKMVTERLADHIKNPIYTFTIHVIMDRSVNAFTIPDGHIFINIGTLLFAKDLDEIAAVIGHEMGHAQLRHIPQAFEQQKEVTAASIAGVVLGTILSAKNPQAGAALIFSSLGGGENMQLAYSRRHEHDADEFGKKLMASSGYDPSAMNRFLSRLNAYYGNDSIPEFLLTHPATPTRISGLSPDSQKSNPDSYYWTMAASVTGLSLPEDEATQRAALIPDPYRKLALAMLETRKGKPDKALSLLKDVDLPLANAYKGLDLSLMGKNEEAYPYLKKYGTSARTQIALAEIMEKRGEYDQAVKILLPYQKQSVRVDYELGILNQKSSHQALSHVSFARYFFKTGKPKAAKYHADKAIELKKDLDAGVVDELNEMKEFIRKQEAR